MKPIHSDLPFPTKFQHTNMLVFTAHIAKAQLSLHIFNNTICITQKRPIKTSKQPALTIILWELSF